MADGKTYKLSILTRVGLLAEVFVTDDIGDMAIDSWLTYKQERRKVFSENSTMDMDSIENILDVHGFCDTADRAESRIVMDMESIESIQKIMMYG